jgi:hypothetical protein
MAILSSYWVSEHYTLFVGFLCAALASTATAMAAWLVLPSAIKHSANHALKRKNAEISRHAERYQSLLKTAYDGIHILDIDGNLIEASVLSCRCWAPRPNRRSP